MKKFTTLIFLLVIGLTTVTLHSCKDDCQDPSNSDCSNYDPCYGKEKTSAYFIVEESLGDKWIECDTIVGRGNVSAVRFTALQDADSFIWKIGSETIHTKSFIRQGFPQKEHIPVSLIVVNHNPNTACFPNDNGRDTFNRTLFTWGSEFYWDEAEEKYVIDNPLPIQGRYQGYFEGNPDNQVTVTLMDTFRYCSKLQYPYIILKSINLPNGYFQPVFDDDLCGYFGGGGWTKRALAANLGFRAYRIGRYNDFESDSIYEIRGFMQLDRDLKNVEIDIEYYPLWDEIGKTTLKKEKFKGIKIE